jgi:ABC-type microcin C transport system permease subunit YejE
MISFASITSFIQAVSLVISLHPIHISVTEIEFDEKEKSLEIMMRVFMDDLEVTLRNDTRQADLDVLEAHKNKTLDPIVSAYLKKQFKITLDNKVYDLSYLGHEEEGDAFIFYIEVQKVKKFKTIQIQNSIIMETHDDQSNLVHVTVREKVKSLRLTRNNPTDKLTFDLK